MNHQRRVFLQLAAGAAALPAVTRVTQAQAYPARPITIVVGAAAGGPTDTIGRIITERMRNVLGQAIVIENNAAAAGSIAHGRVARAAPDGYTLSLGHWGTHVVNGAVYALQYDVLKDFEPVALISSSPYLVVGKRDLPANDLRSLMAWLKANPDRTTQGTSGAGSPGHIGGVSLQSVGLQSEMWRDMVSEELRHRTAVQRRSSACCKFVTKRVPSLFAAALKNGEGTRRREF